MRSTLRRILIGLCTSTTLIACTNIDCLLNNAVYATYTLYDSHTGLPLTLTDTLSVTAAGTDSVLYNRGTDIMRVALPMRYEGTADTLHFAWHNSRGNAATDTLIVAHTNQLHFESLDCPTAVFHTLTGTQIIADRAIHAPVRIDSAVIMNSSVDYEEKEHIRLYITVQ